MFRGLHLTDMHLLTSWPALTGHLNNIRHVMSKQRQHLAACSAVPALCVSLEIRCAAVVLPRNSTFDSLLAQTNKTHSLNCITELYLCALDTRLKTGLEFRFNKVKVVQRCQILMSLTRNMWYQSRIIIMIQKKKERKKKITCRPFTLMYPLKSSSWWSWHQIPTRKQHRWPQTVKESLH